MNLRRKLGSCIMAILRLRLRCRLRNPKPCLRRSLSGKSTYGMSFWGDRVDAATQTRDATPRPTDFPSTTAPTGPFTAEAGTSTNPADAHIRHSYSAGDVGVARCRRPTDSGIHVLTTWLCANVGYDFYSDAQSTYLVFWAKLACKSSNDANRYRSIAARLSS